MEGQLLINNNEYKGLRLLAFQKKQQQSIHISIIRLLNPII